MFKYFQDCDPAIKMTGGKPSGKANKQTLENKLIISPFINSLLTILKK